jgi:multidrug efflux pump subunit AcrA (membrane-fusion protein)
MGMSFILLSAALAMTGPVSQGKAGAGAAAVAAPSSGDPVVEHCLVSLIEEAQIPGREPGVLAALEAKEGLQVKAGTVIGRIDDSEPTAQKRIKSKEHETELEKATNDVNIRYAIAATEVAKAAFDKSVEANNKVRGSVSTIDINKLRLEWKKAELQIEQAQLEKKVAGLTADVKGAEVDGADLSIHRREITSPIDGIVVKVYRHLGEWVAPGDPVVRIVRVDRLRLEAFLNAKDFGPEEIDSKAITVEVDLARGRKVKFPGKVVFVSPLVEAGGEYRVLCDVVNRQENGQWLLRPGMVADMTIHVR